MAITTVFDPPLPSDSPSTFNSKAFATLGDLNAWSTEANALAADANDDATTASSAASTATTQAGIATTQAGTATTQAGIATTKASEALASANAAAASLDSFDDRYLGSKSSNPTLDNDGAALLTGAMYWNSAANEMRVWDGSAWIAAYLPASGYATLNGTETLTNKSLTSPTATGEIYDNGSVRSNIVAVAASDIDCSAGNYFSKTSTGTTFTFSNVPSSRAYAFTLELTHTSGAIGWPGSVQWPGGAAPTLTTGKTHLFTFVTDDGGTRWRGVANINYTH